MDHEYDQNRKHSPAANTSHNDAVEPGQSSRTAALRRPDHPVASGLVQREADATGAMEPSAIQAAAARGVATTSSQLPYLDTIQRAFGRHDVSGVQAHMGAEAAASARAIGAQAYATGNHVVLGAAADLHTVAHEAAHVVQQRGRVQLKGGVGEPGDEYESHADRVADKVDRGESVEALLDEKAPGAESDAAAARVMQRKVAHGTGCGCSGCGPLQLMARSSTTRPRRNNNHPYMNAPEPPVPRREGTRLHTQHTAGADNSTPTTPPLPRKLWDGDRQRLHWLKDVRESVFEKAESQTTNGQKEYACHGRNCQPVRYWPKKDMQVDHKVNFWDNVMMSVDRNEHEIDGHIWCGVLLTDAINAYNNKENLQLMCKSCNPSKGGHKGVDKNPKEYIEYVGPA